MKTMINSSPFNLHCSCKKNICAADPSAEKVKSDQMDGAGPGRVLSRVGGHQVS